ncbi:MAG: hypothetical protein Q9181_004069, partial [Wetmoreana brouardii]
RAGASLMPSPMKAMIAFVFLSSSSLFLRKGLKKRDRVDGRSGACSWSHCILSAFSVGSTPAKTLSAGIERVEATADAVVGLSPMVEMAEERMGSVIAKLAESAQGDSSSSVVGDGREGGSLRRASSATDLDLDFQVERVVGSSQRMRTTLLQASSNGPDDRRLSIFYQDLMVGDSWIPSLCQCSRLIEDDCIHFAGLLKSFTATPDQDPTLGCHTTSDEESSEPNEEGRDCKSSDDGYKICCNRIDSTFDGSTSGLAITNYCDNLIEHRCAAETDSPVRELSLNRDEPATIVPSAGGDDPDGTTTMSPISRRSTLIFRVVDGPASASFELRTSSKESNPMEDISSKEHDRSSEDEESPLKHAVNLKLDRPWRKVVSRRVRVFKATGGPVYCPWVQILQVRYGSFEAHILYSADYLPGLRFWPCVFDHSAVRHKTNNALSDVLDFLQGCRDSTGAGGAVSGFSGGSVGTASGIPSARQVSQTRKWCALRSSHKPACMFFTSIVVTKQISGVDAMSDLKLAVSEDADSGSIRDYITRERRNAVDSVGFLSRKRFEGGIGTTLASCTERRICVEDRLLVEDVEDTIASDSTGNTPTTGPSCLLPKLPAMNNALNDLMGFGDKEVKSKVCGRDILVSDHDPPIPGRSCSLHFGGLAMQQRGYYVNQNKPQGQRSMRLDSIKNPQPRPPPGYQGQPPRKKQKTDRIVACTVPTCGSQHIEEENGYIICQTCGTVLQEANIVSDNMFIETAGGDSMRAGVTVGADATRARTYDALAARITGGMTSREVSEANGKQAIRAVAGHPLNITQDLQDTAMQVYKLALANNFVQGRLTKSVAAVCLYVASRRSRENNKWMLIDFADKCDINVFKLGTIFKALMEVLHLSSNAFGTLEPINIESLILRFAEQMNFGRMKQRIANEAVRIVQRMSRDWMTDGRRPAGICGAALILAARMNNFRRVVREVVYTVKVAEGTIMKRLDEFKDTQSSDLTVEQFRTTDLPEAADPPAFKNKDKVKKKRGRKRKVQESQDDDATENGSERAPSATPTNTNNQLQTPANSQAQRDRQSMPPPPLPLDPRLQAESASQSSEPSSAKRRRGRPPGKTKPPAAPSSSDLQAEAEIEADIRSLLGNQANIDNAKDIHENPDAHGIPLATPESSFQAHTASASSSADIAQQSLLAGTEPGADAETEAPIRSQIRDPIEAHLRSQKRNSLSIGSPHHSPSQSLSLPPDDRHLITSTSTTQSLLDKVPSTEIISDNEFGSDPEIRDCLLTDREKTVKERIWTHENSAYLRAQQSKLLKQQLAEANGTARVVVKRKRRKTRMGDLRGVYDEGVEAPRDAGEAVERMMKKRGFSRKINYANIGSVYTPKWTPSGSQAGSRRGSEAPTPPGPTTSLSPSGEITVEGLSPEMEIGDMEEVGGKRKGDSREEAIEVEDGGESDPDDYYNDDEDMEMAGVNEVVDRLGYGRDGDDDDEDED